MKKSLTILIAFIASFASLSAKSASEYRVYIDPGHGCWKSRPMSLIGHPDYYKNDVVDTLRFFESNTNLQKGFGVLEELVKMGLKFDRTKNQNNVRWRVGAARDFSNNIVMSRVKNGPWPVDDDELEEAYNRDLTDIAEEVECNNFDFFVSIHSDAAGSPDADGEIRSTLNCPTILYRGYDDPYRSEYGVSTTQMVKSRDLGIKAQQYLLRDMHQNYNITSQRVRGDIDFYGGDYWIDHNGYRGYLGVLHHGVPGFLSEGYFHTYSPSRHRMMNWDVCSVEGWYYANAFAEYFGIGKTGKGWIYGIVRDKTKTMNYKQYYAREGTNDVYHPINGCTVVLRKNGFVVQKKVTDNYYNGAYVFKDLAPGTYTVEYYHKNYVSGVPMTVTVTANNITYPVHFINPGTGSDFVDKPLPSGYSEKYDFRHRQVNTTIPELTGKKVRRVVAHGDYLYILALDNSNNPYIYVYNPDRRTIVSVSTAGMDGTELNCSDIQVTTDGVLLACNKELTQSSSAHVLPTDKRQGVFRIYRWANDANGVPKEGPIAWLRSSYTGDWQRSYTGETFAWTGTSSDGMAVFSCESAESHRNLRTMVITVKGGSNAGESVHIPYFNATPNEFSVSTFGSDYRFVTSSQNPSHYLVMGSGSNPIVECEFKHTNKANVTAILHPRAIESGASGGSAMSFGTHRLLLTPVRWTTSVNGVRITDISKGIDVAENATTTGHGFATLTCSSWNVVGREKWKKNESTGAQGTYLDVFLLRDDKLCYLTTAPNTTDPIPVFNEKWCLSDYKGNASSKGWDATQVRNMDFYQGKLYLVYQQKNIKVVNASTGEDLGNLNKPGVYGGTVKLADVKICDGKIVASNIALTSNGDALRLYCWDNDNAMPRVILDTRDFGGAVRAGDCIGWKGTWESGAFYFCSDDGTQTRLLRYDVTDGVVSASPVVTLLTTDGITQLKTFVSARVTPTADGYWIDGRANNATFVGIDGIQKYTVNQANTFGNTLESFTYEGFEYALYTTYDKTDLSKGFMRLVCKDKGWDKTYWIADYPSTGLSATRTNGNGTSSLILYQHGNTIETWVSITNQGVAHYVNREGTAEQFTAPAVSHLPQAIHASRSSAHISAKAGQPASVPISFSGSYLSDDIHLSITGTDAALFSISTDKVGIDSEAETVYVSINAPAEGNYSATLVAESEDCPTLNIRLTAAATGPIEFNDYIVEIKPAWEFTESAGTLANASQWFGTDDRYVSDIALVNGKLYVLNTSDLTPAPLIYILNAYSGGLSTSLNVEGISGGSLPASSLAEIGGHLLLSNYAAGAEGSASTDALRIYRWLDDTSAPTLWLEDPIHGDISCGSSMSTWGDLTDGRILFSDGTKILVYTVANGAISTSPQIITLGYEGSGRFADAPGGNVSVTMNDDGSFWITSDRTLPMHFAADGSFIEKFSDSDLGIAPNGTASAFFNIGNRRYMATVQYLNTTNFDMPLTEGVMTIVNYTAGVDASRVATVNPEAGLGSASNDRGISRILVEKSSDGERLNFWVMVSGQGIAHYRFNGADPSSYIPAIPGVDTGDDSPAIYYDLFGRRINNLPSSGIYIRRQGATADKIVRK